MAVRNNGAFNRYEITPELRCKVLACNVTPK